MQKEQDRIYNHLKKQGYKPCRTKIDIFVNQGGDMSTISFEDLCEDSKPTGGYTVTKPIEKEESRIASLLTSTGSTPDMDKIEAYVKNGGTWADLYQDDAGRNKLAKSKPIRASNGDEYTVPEHKHLQKLINLEDRIARWKHVGPAVTEVQWDQASKDLEHVTMTRRACSADPDYAIPKSLLIVFNNMWKVYGMKEGSALDKIMGGINWSQVANKIGE